MPLDVSLGLSKRAGVVDVSAIDATFDEPSVVRVGTAGNLKVDTAEGQTITIPNMLVGETTLVLVNKVYSTGTTAGSLTRYY